MVEQNVANLVNSALNLIAVVLLTAVPLILVKLTIYVKAKWAEISRNQPEYIRNAIETAATFGIKYAQQKFAEDANVRKEKLDAAIKVAKDFLNTSGIAGIDASTLENAIEALLIPTKLEIAEQKDKLNSYKLTPPAAIVQPDQNVTVNISPVTTIE